MVEEAAGADGALAEELAALLGVPRLGAAERDAVLDLTRVAAHTTARRFGPLVAYAVGLAAGAGDDPAVRTRAVRDAAAALQARAAAADAAADAAPPAAG
jgi:hypothetical protein